MIVFGDLIDSTLCAARPALVFAMASILEGACGTAMEGRSKFQHNGSARTSISRASQLESMSFCARAAIGNTSWPWPPANCDQRSQFQDK